MNTTREPRADLTVRQRAVLAQAAFLHTTANQSLQESAMHLANTHTALNIATRAMRQAERKEPNMLDLSPQPGESIIDAMAVAGWVFFAVALIAGVMIAAGLLP